MVRIIRKASEADLSSVTGIYNAIHNLEKSGKVEIGWNPRVYPTSDTASNALASNTLFVMTIDDEIVASAIINNEQPSAYSLVEWKYAAKDSKVGVLHTLVVDPDFSGQGLGRLFVSFFEDYCRGLGYEVARLDTQVRNRRPYNLYPKLGYRLAGIKETMFQNLPEKIDLAMFEKKL